MKPLQSSNVIFICQRRKTAKKTYGVFEVTRCNKLYLHTFLDYITSGYSLELAVAVDFAYPHSQYPDPAFAEDVEFAVRTIGEQTKQYTSTSTYAAFGFGARIPPQYRESHQFCLNLETDPNCHSIDGIVDAFNSTYTQVQPASTSKFAHIIYHIAKYADNLRKREEGTYPQYFVLVVITRGYIEDLRETVQAIIFSSKAPISIVFVGSGDADFSDLERLGMAGCRLIYQNRRIDRDMMQFVNQTKLRSLDDQLDDVKDAINENALCQIPWQMAKWMMKNGYKPNKGLGQDDEDEQQQAPGTAPVLRRRLTTVRYDSIMGTLSDSDEACDSPTTSGVFSTSISDRGFPVEPYTAMPDTGRSESSESYPGSFRPDSHRSYEEPQSDSRRHRSYL